MRIYIAGKITGNPNYMKQFEAAEIKLSKLGYAVVNPVMEEGYPYRHYINVGLRKIGHCDAIYLLRNWRRSKGARLERKYAKAVGMKVIKERKTAEMKPTQHPLCKTTNMRIMQRIYRQTICLFERRNEE